MWKSDTFRVDPASPHLNTLADGGEFLFLELSEGVHAHTLTPRTRLTLTDSWTQRENTEPACLRNSQGKKGKGERKRIRTRAPRKVSWGVGSVCVCVSRVRVVGWIDSSTIEQISVVSELVVTGYRCCDPLWCLSACDSVKRERAEMFVTINMTHRSGDLKERVSRLSHRRSNASTHTRRKGIAACVFTVL